MRKKEEEAEERRRKLQLQKRKKEAREATDESLRVSTRQGTPDASHKSRISILTDAPPTLLNIETIPS